MKNLILALFLVACAHAVNVVDAAAYGKALDSCYQSADGAYKDGETLVKIQKDYDDCVARADAQFGKK